MRTNKHTSGQSLIEFALVFPLLIFLIFGLFDLGRAVLYFSVLNTATREGTRVAIVNPEYDSKIMSAIEEKLFSLPELIKVNPVTKEITLFCTVTINYPIDPNAPDDPKVEITITYDFKPITPGISLIVGSGGTIPISAHSSMLLSPISKPEQN